MNYYPYPNLKKFSEIQVGELFTAFYAFGGDHSSKVFGIRINVTNATAALVLKAETTDKRVPDVPFIYVLPRGNQPCASFGEDFTIESMSRPSEIIGDVGVHPGCLVYFSGKWAVACRIPDTQQIGCISTSDWSWIEGGPYGADLIQCPKWRIISLVQDHGITEVVRWAEISQVGVETSA